MFQNAFPARLCNEVSKVVNLIPMKTYSNVSGGISEQNIQYFLNGETINIPYRIYFLEVPNDILNKLSIEQQMILHCIYSRSCDGFVRQRHLQALLLMEYQEWAIPYIVKVCDEYVMEILEMNYNILKEQNTECIKKFCIENVEIFCKSYARMTSYWNEFYKGKCFYFHDYIGRKLFKECFGYTRSLEKYKK